MTSVLVFVCLCFYVCVFVCLSECVCVSVYMCVGEGVGVLLSDTFICTYAPLSTGEHNVDYLYMTYALLLVYEYRLSNLRKGTLDNSLPHGISRTDP